MKKSLKFWRTERQISQIALAVETGVPRHRIQLAEQMLLNLKDQEIESIANVLGVKPTQIQGEGNYGNESK